jgi:hypothetical protein
MVKRTVGGTPRSHSLAWSFCCNLPEYVLGGGPLAASTADTAAVDNVTLLGLVSETAGLVGARRTAGAVDDLQLAKLSMHSQQCSTSTPIGTRVPEMCNHTSQHCRNVSKVLASTHLGVRTRTRIRKRIMSDCFFF